MSGSKIKKIGSKLKNEYIMKNIFKPFELVISLYCGAYIEK